jgi:hypothetical protein
LGRNRVWPPANRSFTISKEHLILQDMAFVSTIKLRVDQKGFK